MDAADDIVVISSGDDEPEPKFQPKVEQYFQSKQANVNNGNKMIGVPTFFIISDTDQEKRDLMIQCIIVLGGFFTTNIWMPYTHILCLAPVANLSFYSAVVRGKYCIGE